MSHPPLITDVTAADAKRPWRYVAPVMPVHEAMSRHLIVQAAGAAASRTPGRTPRLARAIVIGAGRCRDIPLRELLARFERVTVTDIDAGLLKRGLADAQLREDERGRIELKVGDSVGLSDAIGRGIDACFAQGVWTASSYEYLIERMASHLERLVPAPPAIERTYDLVVASCVVSQLHLSAVNRVAKLFARRFPDAKRLLDQPRWRQAVATLAAGMQQRFVEMIYELASASGGIYISATPRVHEVFRAPHGKWKTRYRHDMLAQRHLWEFFDARFTIEAQSNWQWAQKPPDDGKKPGDLFDVEAFILHKTAGPARSPV